MKSTLHRLLLIGALVIAALTGRAQIFNSFVDTFDTDLAHWTNLTDSRGSWTLANGQLTGYWPTAFAQYPQANLVVAQQDMAADYDATFTATYPGAGGVGFTLWYTQTAKLNVNLSRTSVAVEKRVGAQSSYYIVKQTAFATPLADGAVTMRLQRRAKNFTVYVQGTQVLQFTDDDFSGNMRVGVKAYGTAVYDAFSFTDAAGLPPDTNNETGGDELEGLLEDALESLDEANTAIASLESQRETANATINSLQQQLVSCESIGNTLQAQVASLTESNAQLMQQMALMTAERDSLSVANAGLTAQNAFLRGQLDALQSSDASVAAALALLEKDLRERFNDPGFLIRGADNSERVGRLVDSVLRLNQGRAKGVYDGLQ